MNVVVDPNGPPLAATPSNPVPEGARAGYFVTSDNVRLRYALFPRKGEVPRGTVCILQGRAEFIEKYFETIADFQARGFAVATFDFRGQGGSERVVPGRLGYVDRFEDYWTDLRSFHVRHARQNGRTPSVKRPVHVIYYRVAEPGLVEIARILHERMEPARQFEADPDERH